MKAIIQGTRGVLLWALAFMLMNFRFDLPNAFAVALWFVVVLAASAAVALYLLAPTSPLRAALTAAGLCWLGGMLWRVLMLLRSLAPANTVAFLLLGIVYEGGPLATLIQVSNIAIPALFAGTAGLWAAGAIRRDTGISTRASAQE